MTPVDPTDYWRLRALSAEQDTAQARLDAAKARREACWQALVSTYRLDPTRAYIARDEDCTLHDQPAGPIEMPR